MTNYYPIMLDIEGKKCIVIGGGEVAYRKALSLINYEAEVIIISPKLCPELLGLAEKRQIKWFRENYKKEHLQESFLVFAATNNREVNRKIYADAQKLNILVNTIDDPEICNFIIPAKLQQGDLTVSVSTNGKSPALAKKICEELTEQFGQNYAVFLDLMAELRILASKTINDSNKRADLYNKIINADFLNKLKTQPEDSIRHEIYQIYENYIENEGNKFE